MKLLTLKDNIAVVAEALRSGALVVLRTDTLYGVLARANDSGAVARLRSVRNREPGKAFITLIATADDAFGDDAAKVQRAYDQYRSSRPTSVVIESSDAPDHLLNHDASLAYRIPRVEALSALLRLVGPLVAPSANPAGLAPARSIDEAENYFGDRVAIYVDDGETAADQLPSAVVQVAADGTIKQIR